MRARACDVPGRHGGRGAQWHSAACSAEYGSWSGHRFIVDGAVGHYFNDVKSFRLLLAGYGAVSDQLKKENPWRWYHFMRVCGPDGFRDLTENCRGQVISVTNKSFL